MFNVISEDFSIYKNIPPGGWGVYVSSDFPTRYSYSHLPNVIPIRIIVSW